MKKAQEFIKIMEEETKWRVWTYDVWGNAEDGYDVNDRYDNGYVDLPAEPTDEQVIQALKDMGILNDDVKLSDLEMDGDDMSFAINAADDGYPLAGLEKESNEDWVPMRKVTSKPAKISGLLDERCKEKMKKKAVKGGLGEWGKKKERY